MKKLLILLVSIVLFSCSSEDGQESINQDLLIGSWQFDDDPGYGDHTFLENGVVEVKYFSEEWGDDFTEYATYTLQGDSLKIFWQDADPGLEIYKTKIIELSEIKLKWKVIRNDQMREESFTRQ
jgi:hypothetical protein